MMRKYVDTERTLTQAAIVAGLAILEQASMPVSKDEFERAATRPRVTAVQILVPTEKDAEAARSIFKPDEPPISSIEAHATVVFLIGPSDDVKSGYEIIDVSDRMATLE